MEERTYETMNQLLQLMTEFPDGCKGKWAFRKELM